jgi:hypothetical protein
MNEQQCTSLARVLEYLADEKKDFEATTDEMRANHIYTDILVLEQYLKGETKP